MRRALSKAARPRAAHAVLALTALGATTALLEGDARACGGCFAPPEFPTVVTDHRMILSVSQTQSTLYDQIRYTGAPQSFAWVLPISGTVTVGLSADVVFQQLDSLTATQIIPPPRNCPPPPACNYGGSSSGGGFAAGQASDAAAPPPGVDVTKHEVVGPYDTVQLHATDPAALETWLAQNNFSIPTDVKPVIDQYVLEKFDFLAVKLLPGQGVQDMRPVRVTTTGASAVLPLRMVAAGTGATVGISLWVVGEGRYEPQNFPTFAIQASELAWDWNANKSNYTDIRAQKAAAGNGRSWEVESSSILYRQQIENGVNPYGPGIDPVTAEQYAQQDYAPVKNPDGTIAKTAVQVRNEDMNALFYGIPTATSRVTRVRSDLAHAALNVDLVAGAAADQATLAPIRVVTQELNQPLCPVYQGCDQVGTLPRDQAAAQSSGGSGAGSSSGGTFACGLTGGSASPAWMGAGAGYLALALARSIRRRRQGR